VGASNLTSNDFAAAAGFGFVDGVKTFNFTGLGTIDTADTDIDLSNLATNIIPLPLNAGESLEIVSSDPADSDTVVVNLITPNGESVVDVPVILTGTTPVVIPGNFSRINDVTSIGVAGFDGTLTVRQATGGTIFAVVLPQNQQLFQGHYTIPVGKKFLVKALIASMVKATGTETGVKVSLLLKRFDQAKYMLIFGFGLQRSGNSAINFVNDYPESADSPYDIKIQVNATSTAPEVLVRANGLIVDHSGAK